MMGGAHGDAWHEAAEWIERNGGRVHPGLRYDPSHRRVYLGHSSGLDDGSNDGSPSFEAGTTLLEIPDACLVTLHAAESDEVFGKSLFGAVHSLLVTEGGHGEEASGNTGNEADGEGLYHDAQDVILALYLAHLREQLECHPEEGTQAWNGSENESSPPWRFYRPYLSTLPSSSSSEASDTLLPRQWSDETVKRRLAGTSLYHRVLREQRGVRREYELAKKAWMKTRGKTNVDGPDESSRVFPSFEQYDCMMAVLTSRGFAGLGRDGVDALIPLLDLLNHVRGKADGGGEEAGVEAAAIVTSAQGTGDNAAEKGGDDPKERDSARRNAAEADRRGPDVRYERYEEAATREGEETPSKRQRMEGNATTGREGRRAGVRVRTARRLEVGSELHMTYGAKGNAALLGRYGFCIEDNVEPDGSCNDVLELEVKEDTKPVELRRGPKSYSYAPFVRALDLCRDAEASGERHDAQEGEGFDDGGLDAFLDSCENDELDDEDDEEEEEDDGLDDYLYNGPANSNAARPDGPHRASMRDDIGAIEKLEGILQNAKAGLANHSLASIINDDRESNNIAAEDRYCAILIRSDIQTLDFYLAAADALRRRLAGRMNEDQTKDVVSNSRDKTYQFDDKGATREQIDALVDAYVSIRYPLTD